MPRFIRSNITLAALSSLVLASCASTNAPTTSGASTSLDSGTSTDTLAEAGAPRDAASSTGPTADGGAPVTVDASADSGPLPRDASAPSAGPVQVGLSNRNFAPGALRDKKAVYDLFVGSHPVAIYTSHATKTDALGLGTLEVIRENAIARMVLKDANGRAVTTVQNNFDTPSGGFVSLLNLERSYKGDVSIQKDTDYIEARFGNGDTVPRGMIVGRTGIEAGWVPNGAEKVYYFRNNVAYAGFRAPEAFAQLAGTYRGASYDPTMTSNRGDVTVTITAAGEVTVSGVNAFNAQQGTLTVRWDGNDDLIVPATRPDNQGGVENSPNEFQIVLNANNGYGSLPKGGVKITIPPLDTLAASPRILSVRADLPTNGALEVRNPTRI